MSENNISRAQNEYRNRSGIELTSEQKIHTLEMEINRLDNLIRELSELFMEHRIGLTKDESNPVGINDIIIGVNDINYPTHFNITQLFNIFETHSSVPFVKFVMPNI